MDFCGSRPNATPPPATSAASTSGATCQRFVKRLRFARPRLGRYAWPAGSVKVSALLPEPRRTSFPDVPSDGLDDDVEDVGAIPADRVQGLRARRTVHVDVGHGRQRAVEDDVVRLLDVDVGVLEVGEDAREHAHAVAM